MLKFRPSKISLALLSSGMMALSIPSFAAETTTDAAVEQTASDETQSDEEVLTIVGIRGSLQKSQATKRNNTSIVEAITAEDIGKLPDSSIAESLARLPGLAAQRLDGRANVISIRGMGPEFSSTTLNGREQVTVGDNRGVEFDQYPSELMSAVVVYKTPDASLMSQGIGATIDLQTISPLAHGKQSMVANIRGERNDLGALNSGSTANGWRGSYSYIDQFANDTIGIALGFAHMESPNQEERWQAWGYPEDGNGNLVLGGAKPFVRSSELTRDGIMGVFEYTPDDSFSTKVDLYYSDFEDKQILRGIEIPVWWGQGWANDSIDVVSTSEGLVTQGRVNNGFALIRNDVNIRDAELTSVGWNTQYQINDNWELTSDLSYSKVDRSDFGLESYAGTGRGTGVGASDTLGFSMGGAGGAIFNHGLDYSDPNLFFMGGAFSWANGITLPGDAQDGFVNTPNVEDELTALRLSVDRALSGDTFKSIEFGINYSDREKSKLDTGFFLTLPQYPAMLPVPAEYLQSPTSLAFIGMGNVLSYDSLAFYRDGNYQITQEDLTVAGRSTNSWSVQEEVITGFIKANIDAEWGGLPVTGNLGLQVVRTDQSSSGNAAGPDVDNPGFVQVVRVSGSESYTELLPSLNLAFELPEEQVVRLGVARTMARARMDQMNASRSFSYNSSLSSSTDIQNSPWGGGGGNPGLKPWMAKQLDVSYEKYFAKEGYFAAAVFYKDIESWVFNDQIVADFSGISVEDPQPALSQGLISVPTNGYGGFVKGVELTLSLAGNTLADSLDGFGAVLSYTYNDAEVKATRESEPVDLEGLSKNVGQATLYYEKDGWQLRTSARYRSDFLGEVTGLSLVRQSVFVKSETIIDAQIGYDFSQSDIEGLDGLSVFLQVNNLNDEPFTTFQNGDERQVRDFQVYGTNYLLGASYQF